MFLIAEEGKSLFRFKLLWIGTRLLGRVPDIGSQSFVFPYGDALVLLLFKGTGDVVLMF